MRDVRSGNKDNVRYRTQETVERVRLDQSDFTYLYNDGADVYTFMAARGKALSSLRLKNP